MVHNEEIFSNEPNECSFLGGVQRNQQFFMDEDELAHMNTAQNTPDKPVAQSIQQIVAIDVPKLDKSAPKKVQISPIKTSKPQEPEVEKKAYVISQKGRKMKRSDVMQQLKQEYLKDPNWNKHKKQELCERYGVTYSQLYKLHWDWKEKELRDREKISETAQTLAKETLCPNAPWTRSKSNCRVPELVQLFKIVRVEK
jgi:hypothetical protein